MATGTLDANGVWQYGEDDSAATFSALLNKLSTSIGSDMKGRILQVVTASASTTASNSGTSYAETGLTATITPKKASSKIVVFVHQSGVSKSPDNSGNGCNVRLTKNGAALYVFADSYGFNNLATWAAGQASTIHVETAGVTSAITYATQFANRVAASSVFTQFNNSTSKIVLVEISN